MEQKINLAINKPCMEKFNQFSKIEKGGFCGSCKKEVIDFRSMSDKQVSSYFKNKSDKTCGYFDASQLNKDFKIHEIEAPKRLKFLKIAAVTFLSLTSLHNIQAQEVKQQIEVVQTSINKDKSDTSNTQGSLLSGIIAEKDGPLPGANIILKGTTIGTSTNFDGEFTFPKPLKVDDVLVVSYLGFVTKQITIKEEQTQLNAILNIDMKADVSCALLGEVDVKTVYKSKPTLWQRVKRIF